jgi:hypothetical protein
LRVFVLLLGLALLSPLLWLGSYFLGEFLPRTKSWDLSSNHSISELDPKARRSVERDDHDAQYSYQGNIHSTVRLPSGRQWSGKANLVIFEALGGTITAIDWKGQRDSTDRVYQQARQILHDLKLPNHDLDSWYAKASSGERISLVVQSNTHPRIRVDIRGFSTDEDHPGPETTTWYVNVYVEWKSAGR